MHGHISMGGNDYEFEGQKFEMHPYCGPWPLKKNGEPRASIPSGFWKVWKKWNALDDEEKKETLVRVGGSYFF